jgi:hypothetical protein
MKNAVSFLVVLAVLLIGSELLACTATGTLSHARRMRDSDEYKVVRAAVVDDIATPREWVYAEAVEAAVGATMFEAFIGTNRARRRGRTRSSARPRAVDSYEHAMEILYSEARIRHAYWDFEDNTKSIRVKTVRDHAIMHGEEWEHGIDVGGRKLDDHWYETPRVSPTVDHAG